jgi:long-subunit fatty acid transport protein
MYGIIYISRPEMITPYVPMIILMKGTGFGVGANLGLLWKALPNLSIGLSGKLPSTIQILGTVEASLLVNSALSGTPEGEKIADRRDTSVDFKLPAEAGIGIAFFARENWVITMDISNTMWKRFSKIQANVKGALDVTFDSLVTNRFEQIEIQIKWQNTWRAGMGTEYMKSNVTMRVGIFFDESPIPESNLYPNWLDTSTRISLNAGLGYKFHSLRLDLAAENSYFSKRTVDFTYGLIHDKF